MIENPLPKSNSDGARTAGVAAGLGFSVVISLIFFIGLGVFLDQRFDMAPIFTLVGLLLGLIAAGYQLYELTQIGRNGQAGGPIARTIARGTQASRPRKNQSPR